jgi:hypothetical protein
MANVHLGDAKVGHGGQRESATERNTYFRFTIGAPDHWASGRVDSIVDRLLTQQLGPPKERRADVNQHVAMQRVLGPGHVVFKPHLALEASSLLKISKAQERHLVAVAEPCDKLAPHTVGPVAVATVNELARRTGQALPFQELTGATRQLPARAHCTVPATFARPLAFAAPHLFVGSRIANIAVSAVVEDNISGNARAAGNVVAVGLGRYKSPRPRPLTPANHILQTISLSARQQ